MSTKTLISAESVESVGVAGVTASGEPVMSTSTESRTSQTAPPNESGKVETSSPHPLNDRWWLWTHGMLDKDYSKDSYKRIGDPLVTIEQYLGLWRAGQGANAGSLERLRERVADSMFFLMRHGPGEDDDPIYPMWEDRRCDHGGAWKFRVPLEDAPEAFHDIAIRLLGETISDHPEEILGVSISPKKKAVTIRIWNSNDSKRDAKQLHLPDRDYFKEVLYDAHQDYKK